MKKLVCVLLCLVAFSSYAKNCEQEAENGGMVAMRECIVAESEKPVTAAYNSLIKALGDNQEAINAIKEAQTDWLKFRDSTCYYISVTDNLDEAANCKADFNKARAKILTGYTKAAKK